MATPFKNILTSAFMFFWLLPHGAAHAEQIEYDGLIEPFVVIDLGAPSDGIVSHVDVDRSSLIHKGQVLLSLESSVEKAAFEKAEALSVLSGDISLQHTQHDFAKRVYERYRQSDAFSPQDKDQAKTDVELTRYRLLKARENKALAQLDRDKAKAVLNKRTVKSPIDGVVVERYVSPGVFVSNQPVLRIAQIDPLRVEVIVPSHMFGQIKPGMPAVIKPELADYGEHTATVTLVDKVIDSASNTFGVRLELPNKDRTLPSGLRCQVQFDLDHAEAKEKAE